LLVRSRPRETRRSWRAPGWTTREALLVRYSDHRVLPTRLGSPMMPPYDTVVRAILPAPPAAGAEKFSAPLPAGAAPDDVWHWFHLETILTSPEPVVTFVDAADAVHQYPTRLERGRGRFTAWYAIRGQTVLQAFPGTVTAFLPAAAHGNLAVKTVWLRQAVIRYLHPCRDQARAPSPVEENTALVLDRLRSALLTIPATLPGLHDRALLLVGFARDCGRARSPSSKYPELCATRTASSLICPAQDRSGRTRHKGRLPVGRTDLCPVKDSTPGSRPRRSPRARSSGGSGACLHRAERRAQIQASASTLPGWLRRFDSTDRPAMDRARRV
jgi:hypothetical protein